MTADAGDSCGGDDDKEEDVDDLPSLTHHHYVYCQTCVHLGKSFLQIVHLRENLLLFTLISSYVYHLVLLSMFLQWQANPDPYVKWLERRECGSTSTLLLHGF